MPVEQAQVSRTPAQKKSQRAAEQDRPDVAQARDQWRASQGELNPERLVFIEETGAATDMARRYGRCPRGQRLVSSVPWGHWKTTTFVAALLVGEVAAPCVFDGPMDGESFRAYVESGRHQGGHRTRQRQTALSARPQSRSQSDRAALRQDQSFAAKSCRQDLRHPHR